MARTTLKRYFLEEMKAGGLTAYKPRPYEEKGSFRPDLADLKLLKQSDVAKCFEVFGEYAETAKAALFMLIIDNASPTEIASRLRRAGYAWKRALNSKNIHQDIEYMEEEFERAAIERGVIKRE